MPADDHVELLACAREARDRSYAPYSDFHMGAAVRGDDGSLTPGVLIENVSLGLAMCAERTALFAAVARGIGPVGLALVSPRTSGELTYPCGACLQVALELAGPALPVIVGDLDGVVESHLVGDLLSFGPRRHTFRAVSWPR
jgi:cytidine deaminase